MPIAASESEMTTQPVPRHATFEKVAALQANVERVIRGKSEVVQFCIAALLAKGHILLEDVPGVGKTTLAHALARSLSLSFQRIQFTSDLLPADIVGVTIYNQDAQEFEFISGPVFTNILLADEINRATPKSQSALLEAMSEGMISIEKKRLPLPDPFLVLATQNPIEHVGTYPLPESQLDRFILAAEMGPPTDEEAMEVLARREHGDPIADLRAVVGLQEVVELQDACLRVVAAPAIRTYIVALLNAIRSRPEVLLPASMRSGVYLQRAAQAWALFEGRDFVLPDDIKLLAVPVLSHRLGMRGRVKAIDVIGEIVTSVPLPPLRQH